MAITTNNVQNVKFLRNGSLFTSREAARAALETNKTLGLDGSAILARYSGETATDVKTLVGFIWNDGGNATVTIFDIEGASSEVETLRTEINNKLGSGITSANTATAQLTALSGNSSSTSAETSVEGAKRYADQILSDAISALDYSGVTTGEGVYITNVTEADGVVAATTATLPTVGAISEAGKPITAVSESLGTISAAAGTINAEFVNIADSGSLISATTVEGALAEIAAEIDAMDKGADVVAGQVVTTVSETDGKVSETKANVKDLQLGGYSKDSSATGDIASTDTINAALSKLENKAAAITIGNTDHSINVTTNASGTDVAVNIKSGEKVIKLGNDGIYTNLNLVEITGDTLPAAIKVRYELRDSDGAKIGESIDIPKDSHIVSITYNESTQKLVYTYIDVEGVTQITEIDLSHLVLETEFASGVTFSNGVAHGVVDPTSEKFLTVGADGFKISGVSSLVENAIDALDADKSGSTTHITVGVKEENGVITAVTVAEDNIANASDLAELSGKTVTEVASSNESITAALSAATDGTKHLDIITDASKIKMTGFTSTDVLSGINATSSVTEAFEEVDKVITENEETVSAALNDLNERIDELSGGTAGDLAAEIAARKAVDGQNGDRYTANSGKTYISGATSLNDADIKLNDALKAADDAMLTGVTAGNGITVSDKANKSQTISAKVKNDDGIVNDADGLHLGYIDAGVYDVQ